MKLSSKTRYGLRAMAYLAKEKRRCSLKEISCHEKIPLAYLEKIFSDLKKQKLVEAKRGGGGGYLLAKKAKNISVAEIVKIFEKDLAPVFCLINEKKCPNRGKCLTHDVWSALQESLSQTLEDISLSDLISKKI